MRQVEAHLDNHLAQLPAQDQRSWAVLAQMKQDEVGHADMAEAEGAAALPARCSPPSLPCPSLPPT